MRPPVVAIYNSGDFQKAVPYVYTSNGWTACIPYVYNGKWEQVGSAGTLLIALKDSGGNKLYSSDEQLLLVRQD